MGKKIPFLIILLAKHYFVLMNISLISSVFKYFVSFGTLSLLSPMCSSCRQYYFFPGCFLTSYMWWVLSCTLVPILSFYSKLFEVEKHFCLDYKNHCFTNIIVVVRIELFCASLFSWEIGLGWFQRRHTSWHCCPVCTCSQVGCRIVQGLVISNSVLTGCFVCTRNGAQGQGEHFCLEEDHSLLSFT